MTYPRMDIVKFGKDLFDTGDLDPVYTALQGARLETEQLHRWLVSYWCFYHSGFASYASEREGRAFWKVMETAAKNFTEAPSGGRWPRGTERRHFRGAAAIHAVHELSSRYGKTPEKMVEFLVDGPMNVQAVIDRATTHRLFGPWIAFKVADMIDIFVEQVAQDDVSVFLYDTPRQSIMEHLPELSISEELSEGVRLEKAMHWLKRQLRACRIPHKPGQRPDWFSLETVWCKHLSHMHGFYPMGKDTIEIGHGIYPWRKVSETADIFANNLPYLATEELISA